MALSPTTRQTWPGEGWESGSPPPHALPAGVGPWEPTEALLLASQQQRQGQDLTAEGFLLDGAERHLDGLTLLHSLIPFQASWERGSSSGDQGGIWRVSQDLPSPD